MKRLSLLTPILAPLLQNRSLCRAVTGAAAVHLTLVSLSLPSWPCPIRHGLGIPCPGCGLTRAIKSLATGHWQQAFLLHAFAPLALAVIALMVYVSFAPTRHRHWIVRRCGQMEHKTGISAFFLVLFMVYWLIRLLLFREAFYHWVL